MENLGFCFFTWLTEKKTSILIISILLWYRNYNSQLFLCYFDIEITFRICNNRFEMKTFYGPLKCHCGPHLLFCFCGPPVTLYGRPLGSTWTPVENHCVAGVISGRLVWCECFLQNYIENNISLSGDSRRAKTLCDLTRPDSARLCECNLMNMDLIQENRAMVFSLLRGMASSFDERQTFHMNLNGCFVGFV